MFLKPRKKIPPIRSLIGETTVVHGHLKFGDGLRVDGEVQGDISAQGEGRNILVIGEKARVHGKVSAGHVIISGQVRGPVHSTELLELQPQARVFGDVRYQVLEMHPGAIVEGELKPLRAPSQLDKPPLKLAASNDA
jgi:cytoskeletal protein CcmA (bactofilin family)